MAKRNPLRHYPGGTHGSTGYNNLGLPIEPFCGTKLDNPPVRRTPHAAMCEKGVLGPSIRLDEVGERYGYPMRVRSPSGTGLKVLRPDGDGIMVEVEERKSFRFGMSGLKVWGGGIMVHPIDYAWKPGRHGRWA